LHYGSAIATVARSRNACHGSMAAEFAGLELVEVHARSRTTAGLGAAIPFNRLLASGHVAICKCSHAPSLRIYQDKTYVCASGQVESQGSRSGERIRTHTMNRELSRRQGCLRHGQARCVDAAREQEQFALLTRR